MPLQFKPLIPLTKTLPGFLPGHSSSDSSQNRLLHNESSESKALIKKVSVLLAINKKEMLPFAATLMDLEGIVLREISQTEKDKYCLISLICGT